jgi:hypothetical protein
MPTRHGEFSYSLLLGFSSLFSKPISLLIRVGNCCKNGCSAGVSAARVASTGPKSRNSLLNSLITGNSSGDWFDQHCVASQAALQSGRTSWGLPRSARSQFCFFMHNREKQNVLHRAAAPNSPSKSLRNCAGYCDKSNHQFAAANFGASKTTIALRSARTITYQVIFAEPSLGLPLMSVLPRTNIAEHAYEVRQSLGNWPATVRSARLTRNSHVRDLTRAVQKNPSIATEPGTDAQS